MQPSYSSCPSSSSDPLSFSIWCDSHISHHSSAGYRALSLARASWQVVAVILENFTTLGNAIPTLVSPNDIENFREAWAEFDPDADECIPASKLPALLLRIPPPLGLKTSHLLTQNLLKRRAHAVAYCARLSKDGLQEHDGEVRFQEVVDALLHRNLHDNDEVPPDPETAPPEVARLLRQRTTPAGMQLANGAPSADVVQKTAMMAIKRNIRLQTKSGKKKPVSPPQNTALAHIRRTERLML